MRGFFGFECWGLVSFLKKRGRVIGIAEKVFRKPLQELVDFFSIFLLSTFLPPPLPVLTSGGYYFSLPIINTINNRNNKKTPPKMGLGYSCDICQLREDDPDLFYLMHMMWNDAVEDWKHFDRQKMYLELRLLCLATESETIQDHFAGGHMFASSPPNQTCKVVYGEAICMEMMHACESVCAECAVCDRRSCIRCIHPTVVKRENRPDPGSVCWPCALDYLRRTHPVMTRSGIVRVPHKWKRDTN